MAADLIEKPDILQTFVHDIESAFFLLLWMALLFVNSSWQNPRLSSFINDIFHPPVFGGSGGSLKAMFMRLEQLETLKFPGNAHLANLLHAWQSTLAVRYTKQPERDLCDDSEKFDLKDVILCIHPQDDQGAESPPKVAATNGLLQEETYKQQLQQYELLMRAFRNHDVFLDILSRFFKIQGWPTNEPAAKQNTVLSHTEKQSLPTSSKRCREAAAEFEGNTLVVPMTTLKRNKSL